MYLLGKHTLDLQPSDILQLFELEIPEGKSLDYKKELPQFDETHDKGKSKANFLSDVTAMYNTEGGCIIYGIEEQKGNPGKPFSLQDLTIDSGDVLDRRIMGIVKNGTDPGITNIAIKHLIVEGKKILVLGIGKGLGLPSMITYNQLNKFYKRNLSANYGVDTNELNRMFMQNQSIPELAEKFKNERVKKVFDDHFYANLDTKGAFFAHAFPYSFKKNDILDLGTIKANELEQMIEPLMVATRYNRPYHGIEKEFNYEGFMTSKVYGNPERIFAYNQIFRNGVMEFYSNEFVLSSEEHRNASDYLLGSPLIKGIIQSIQRAVGIWKFYQVEPPFLVYVTIRVPTIYGHLTGIYENHVGPFKKNLVDFPCIYFERHDYTEKEIYNNLRKYMNILWQTAGKASCPSADEFFAPDNLY